MKKNIIITLAILSNLLIGNGLFMQSDDPNYPLMITLSISCIAFNYLLFSKMSNRNRKKRIELTFAFLTSLTICAVGVALACIIKLEKSDQSLLITMFEYVGTTVIMVIAGIFVSYSAIIGFSILNFVWIRILKFAMRDKETIR